MKMKANLTPDQFNFYFQNLYCTDIFVSPTYMYYTCCTFVHTCTYIHTYNIYMYIRTYIHSYIHVCGITLSLLSLFFPIFLNLFIIYFLCIKQSYYLVMQRIITIIAILNFSDTCADNVEVTPGGTTRNPKHLPPLRRWSSAKGTSPYEILGIKLDASQSDVRKAYRTLAKEYHPDKHMKHSSNHQLLASQIFEEIVQAYSVLGSPDNRAAFDDFGGGQGGEDADGYDTYYEYLEAVKKKEAEGGGSKGSQNFYTGETLVTNLSPEMWVRRVHGDQIWMLEFYAPWCTHCKQMTSIWKQAAEELEGDVQFGAINCETHRPWCTGKHWQIQNFPTIKIIQTHHHVTETYPVHQQRTKESLLQFAHVAMADWNFLFGANAVVALDTLSTFNETLLHDPMESFWVVLFTQGYLCEDCRTARTNMIRLSGAVSNVARVGTVDCSVGKVSGGVSGLFNPVCARHLGLTSDGTKLLETLPVIRGYAQGNAQRKGVGAALIDPKEEGGAALVELLETTILLALSNVMSSKLNEADPELLEKMRKQKEEEDKAVGHVKTEEEEKKKKKSKYDDKDPPPPPPGGERGYGGRPKRVIQRRVGGGKQRRAIGGRL